MPDFEKIISGTTLIRQCISSMAQTGQRMPIGSMWSSAQGRRNCALLEWIYNRSTTKLILYIKLIHTIYIYIYVFIIIAACEF